MIKIPDQKVLDTVLLESIEYYAEHRTPIGSYLNGSFRLRVVVNHMTATIIHHLTTNVLGKEDKHEHVPTTWWQHFKQQCFPEYLLRRYPVKTRKIVTILKICPHIDIDYDKGKMKHLRFFVGDSATIIGGMAKCKCGYS